MNGYIDPTKEAFTAFRENAQKGSSHMLNLVRFRKIATYPDGWSVTLVDVMVQPTENCNYHLYKVKHDYCS
jgi:hypothetical protein